ncbi:MAG: hypothetical protein ACOYJD_07490 [Christensenellales bacterium]|jgi:HEAT repeat protein
MKNNVDLETLFEKHIKKWLSGQRGVKPEELEERAADECERWLELPNDELDGLSPRDWFGRMDTRRLLALFEQNCRAKNVPGLMIEELSRRDDAAADLIKLLDNDACAPKAIDALMLAGNDAAAASYISMILDGRHAEHAAEALLPLDCPDMVYDAMLGAGDDARDCFFDIMVEKGDIRAYKHILDAFEEQGEDRRHIYARMLGKLGDERAIEPLMAALSKVQGYFEFCAFRDAIEQLGGEVDMDFDFENDIDYLAVAQQPPTIYLEEENGS